MRAPAQGFAAWRLASTSPWLLEIRVGVCWQSWVVKLTKQHDG